LLGHTDPYAEVIGPASLDRASELHGAELPRKFLRHCQYRCGQRDLCMASASVASDSSVASASAAIACVASASVPPQHDRAHVAPHSVQLPAVLGVRSQREAPERTDARA
jgi:hypothetical protein